MKGASDRVALSTSTWKRPLGGLADGKATEKLFGGLDVSRSAIARTFWSIGMSFSWRTRFCFSKHAAALLAGLACGLTVAQTGRAQEFRPPAFPVVDERGVDLATGNFTQTAVDVTIGQPGAGGLTYSRFFITDTHGKGGWRSNHRGIIASNVEDKYMVAIGSLVETFTKSGSIYYNDQITGSTLTQNGQTYAYTTADGTVAFFTSFAGVLGPIDEGWSMAARIVSVTSPSGEQLTYHYNDIQDGQHSRLQSVTNNHGYQIHIQYQSDTFPAGWDVPYRVTGVNNSIDYCDPLAEVCQGFTTSWPYAQYAYAYQGYNLPVLYTSVTDSLGREVSYTYSTSEITGVRYPSSSTDDLVITYEDVGYPFPPAGTSFVSRVASVTVEGVGTWTYSFAPTPTEQTVTVTDPLGQTHAVHSTLNRRQVLTDTDGLGRVTSYQWDVYGQLTRITRPEGDYVEYAYGARGNVIQITEVPKSGSGLASIATVASYPPSCATPYSPAMCNKPTSVTDARGYRTDYTYDPTHGGVLTITSPAPSGSAPIGSGTRPQTRFGYAQFTARYYVAPGNTDPGAPIWRPTYTSACATGSAPSCVGTEEETVTSTAYPSAGTPNNLLPISTTVRDGDTTISATTAVTYTPQGDVKTIDGPLSGTADTTRFYYGAARQLTGAIGPDPDGGGALKYRAVQTTYNLDGQPTVVEQGTTTNQGDTAFSTFALLEKQDTVYDGAGRPVQSRLWNGGSIVALTQMNYDSVGRPLCTAVRMNSSEFSSPPSNACDDAAGGAEVDRITHYQYDAAGQVVQTHVAYDTGLQQNGVSIAYTSNGLVDYFYDSAGNKTDNVYDGFDRLTHTYYPHPTNVGTSSTTDYEQVEYDAYGRLVKAHPRHPGQADLWFAYTYDNLGQVTFLDAPSGVADVTTTYDSFGRVLSDTGSTGFAVTNVYDPLSRLTSQSQNIGTVSYQYDAAGRRTRMDYPGPNSFYVTYQYNAASDLTAILQQGSTTLASFAHDDLGRRTSLTRGNGVVTSYAFDAVSRLATLTQNPAGTSHDTTLTFSYNPASQITSRTRTNGLYDWLVPASSTTSYSDNGLNQYTAVGGVTPTYDARGNLTGDGSKTYGFDAANSLTSVSGGVTLNYDPLGRLSRIIASSTTRFLYDGADVIAEHDAAGSGVLRRYVHGPGVDEPIVWLEGDGVSDRRWLVPDERGSIIAVTNASGTVTNVNSYDAFGQPGSANSGRFQYTGQMWIAEAGLYHMKARAYHPGLGRFLQTDPIGVGGGMNLYGYVGNDPVNFVDPGGLCGRPGHTREGSGPEGPGSWGSWQYPDCGGGLGGGVGGAGSGTQEWSHCEYYFSCDWTTMDDTAFDGRWYQSGPFSHGDTVASARSAPTGWLADFNWWLYDSWMWDGVGGRRYGFTKDAEGWAAFWGGMIAGDGAGELVGGLGGLLAKACGCFEEGAEVATPDGPRPIEEIAVGDLVLAWNEDTGELAAKAVTALIRPEPRELYELVLADPAGAQETFSVTDDHPWMVEGKGWTETIALQPGDRIETATDETLTVASLAFTGEIAQTYNLEVDGWHTFLVGDGQAVVHNGTKACWLWHDHHAWPKFLGGPENQTLVTLSNRMHTAYHSGLTAALSGSRSLSTTTGQAFVIYTAQFDARYGTNLLGAARAAGFPY